MGHKLAIDFGTTNTVITHWDEAAHAAEVVHIPGISSPIGSVPSLLYVQNGIAGTAVMGQMVRDQNLDHQQDNRLFRNFKRGIVARPAPQPRPIDGVPWGDREAGRAFIRRLLSQLPQAREGIEQLVLTAPVEAFEGYLQWLEDATAGLSAQQVQVMDESTAAALGYAVTEPGAPVLVFDFGGGTLDLSLVQLPESRETTGGLLSRLRLGNARQNMARVIAKTGRILGGSDIDQWLLLAVLEQAGLTTADLGSGYANLLTLCEQAKINLSTQEEVRIVFEAGGRTQRAAITRAGLEQVLEQNGFYHTLRYVIDKLMHIAHRRGVYKEDVRHVLMVGGTSLMPSVQAALQGYFSEHAVHADKPFTAVSEGALGLAAGYGLDDYLNQSYGLRYLNAETSEPRYDEIIPAGTGYPTQKPVEILLGAAHNGQTALDLVIGEIGGEKAELVEVQYEDGQQVFVARNERGGWQNVVALNKPGDLQVALQQAGKPGEPLLKASFIVDSERGLYVSVHDLKTRRKLLENAFVATLHKRGNGADQEEIITGAEPQVIQGHSTGRRLSLRGLATMFNALPPEAISVEAARAALLSDNFSARYNAARALSRRGDRDARLAVQYVLEKGSVPARASAARHLSGFSWYAAEPLIRLALADADVRVREGVMYALSGFGTLAAFEIMAEALEHEADNVREAAAYGLRDCQDPAAVPVLRAALLAEDADVRIKALEALSANDTPQAAQVVRAALNDEDGDAQYAAVLSLLELEGAAALAEVAALAIHARGYSRQQILRALFHASNYLNLALAHSAALDAVLQAVEAALQDRAQATREAAVWLLSWIRNERAVQILMRAYDTEGDEALRARIVQIAVSLMSEAGEAILSSALNSADPQVRRAAERIITQRETTGITLTYDESAALGRGLARPARGR